MSTTKWVNICKTGTWTAKSGNQVTLTESDLDAVVSKYNPEEREAPLVFGHPKEDGPAFGWVEKLRRVGEYLQAQFKQVPEAVIKLVGDGRYKKVSCALFPDMTLRHVGLLGAVQPAVAGLGDVKFDDGGQAGIEIIELQSMEVNEMPDEDLKKTIDQLKADLAAAQTQLSVSQEDAKKATAELAAEKKARREKELETRISDLVTTNRIVPADVPAVKAVALAIGEGGEEIELSEGSGKKRLVDHLFDFLKALPDRKMLNEFSADSNDGDDAKIENLTNRV